jgi:hypothetical protein
LRLADSVGIDMDHLGGRMHAGVCAAGAPGSCGRRRKFAQGALDGVLHAAAVGLRLPARKRRTVIGQAERDPHQSAPCESNGCAHKKKPGFTGR